MAMYKKQVSVGSFLEKGKDIKDGDIIQIANEGKQVEGKFGMQDLFLIKTKEGKEGNVSFNQTSINCLVEAYGEESKNWIGKTAKIWAILSNVQGKMVKVYYFTHPNAELDETGGFALKGNNTAPSTQNTLKTPLNAVQTPEDEEITADEIPF